MKIQPTVRIAKKLTVSGYWKAHNSQQRLPIANAIYDRLFERYLTPLQETPTKSGFCMMAVCCLLIEALQSFWQGHAHSKKKGASMRCFKDFFIANKQFLPLRESAEQFYSHVRCGILHQAETTGGWRINRRKERPLFDPVTFEINADKFQAAVIVALRGYRDELIRADWESPIWDKTRKKMKSICRNCKPL